MTELISILFLATFIEGTVQYLFAKEHLTQPWLKYVSLAFGIIVAIFYKVDIPAMIGLNTAIPIVNYCVSGVIMGRGANYVNDIISKFRGLNKEVDITV